MFPLHKAPLGLLQLFRLRTDGRMPDKFVDSVQPVVEAAEFYGAPSMIGTTSTPTVGALDLTELFPITAPIRMRSLAGILVVGAAPATVVCLDIGLNDENGTTIPLHSIFADQVGDTNVLVAATTFARPMIVRAGYTIYARASGSAAGADHTLSVVSLIDIITGND